MSNIRPPSLESYQPRLERSDPSADRPPQLRPSRGQGGRRKAAPPSAGARAMSAAMYVGLGLVCIVLAAGTFLLIAAPTDIIRDQIVSQVKARTGRDLVLAGPTSFTFFPSIGVRLANVTLSAPPAMGGKPTITMAGLDVTVKLTPLLRREVVVERLIMRKPEFDLRVDAQGRKSWDLAAVTSPHPGGWPHGRYAQASSKALPSDLKDFVRNASDPVKAQHGAARASLEGLALGDVRIEDGTLIYSDARTGARHHIGSIDVRLGLKSIASPLDAKGSLAWKGEKLMVDGKLASVQSLLEDKPAKLALKITGQRIDAAYDGSVAMREGLEASGKVEAKAASLRELARWLGSELPPASGFGAASLAGDVKASERSIALEGLQIELDGATATGVIGVELGGARPQLKANLKLSEFDLNKYSPQAGASPRALASSPAAKAATQTKPASGANSIEDLLRDETAPAKPGPQVRGFEQRTGWSDEPIDLAALGLFDADLKLSCGRVFHQDIKLGQSQLTVALKAGVARVNLDDIQLYEGRGRGFMTLDASGQVPVLGINVQVEGISALPLLKDAVGFETLAGRGRLAIALVGQGPTQRKIVETLNGKADFTFNDGAIVGWNIPQILRGLQQGRISGLDKTATEKTDFSELAATFTVTNGVAQNKDMRMVSPLLRVTGAGNIMLPARQVDYVVRPKLVASLAGQGTQQDAAGLDIPVKIQGSWDKPNIAPDVSGILKDPNQAAAAAERIGEQLGIKGAGNAVRNFLGSGPKDGTQQKPRQLLDQFLKR